MPEGWQTQTRKAPSWKYWKPKDKGVNGESLAHAFRRGTGINNEARSYNSPAH